MCYNCGCGLPNDQMGKGKAAITNETFDEAAKAFGMSSIDAKKETLKLLKKELGEE